MGELWGFCCEHVGKTRFGLFYVFVTAQGMSGILSTYENLGFSKDFCAESLFWRMQVKIGRISYDCGDDFGSREKRHHVGLLQ